MIRLRRTAWLLGGSWRVSWLASSGYGVKFFVLLSFLSGPWITTLVFLCGEMTNVARFAFPDPYSLSICFAMASFQTLFLYWHDVMSRADGPQQLEWKWVEWIKSALQAKRGPRHGAGVVLQCRWGDAILGISS